MDLDRILDLARQVYPKTELSHISRLSGGFSSQACKIALPGNPFVLLVRREGAVSEANYGHAFVVLSLLQKHRLGHAPRPVWLASDHNALAISFESGTAADEFDFKGSGIDTEQLAIKVIDSLLDTAIISLDEYRDLAAELGVEPLPVQTTQDAASKYGTAWLKIVQASCPDQAIVQWLDSRVKQSVQLAKELGGHAPSLGHGDPSNPNILISNDGSYTLIDWDSARFHTTGPEFYVAYTTHLTDFMKPYRQALTAHAARRFDMPVPEFAERVREFRRYSEVFDVNWAAMMMAKVDSGEVPGNVDYFHRIAMERIRIYEESFGKQQ